MEARVFLFQPVKERGKTRKHRLTSNRERGRASNIYNGSKSIPEECIKKNRVKKIKTSYSPQLPGKGCHQKVSQVRDSYTQNEPTTLKSL